MVFNKMVEKGGETLVNLNCGLKGDRGSTCIMFYFGILRGQKEESMELSSLVQAISYYDCI